MQFPVPQFIDVEDKIIGPFTLKQFGFVFGGGILVLAIFKLFGFGFVFFILGIPATLLTLFVSFGSFNGKKVYEAIPIFFKYVSSPKAMVFEKERSVSGLNVAPITVEQIEKITAKQAPTPEVEPAQTQLKRLSRLLDQKSTEEQELSTKN